jgi:glycosyltransferase involved in cell wall biosynthesis
VQLIRPVSTGFHTNFHSYSKYYGIGFLKKPIEAYLRKFHNRALATLVPTEGRRQELDCCGFQNLHVISRGVDTSLFSPLRRNPELRRAWGAGEHVTLEAMASGLGIVAYEYAAARQCLVHEESGLLAPFSLHFSLLFPASCRVCPIRATCLRE